MFLYWLRTNDIYFLEKKTKRHNWKRFAERQKRSKSSGWHDNKKTKQNRDQISNNSSDSCVKKTAILHHHLSPPDSCSDHANVDKTSYLADLIEQRPRKEYCLIYHQFFSPCQFPASFSFSFPVIYCFHLHIKTHLLIKRICVVDVAIENTHGSKIMFGCIDWVPVYFFPSII